LPFRPACLLRGIVVVGLVVGSEVSCGDDTGSAVSATHAGNPRKRGVGPNLDLPIKHVVVILKENHTFDNYFGTFPGAEGTTKCLTTKGQISVPHAPNVTGRDLSHGHDDALTDWNDGKMDGWLAVPGASVHGDDLFCAQYLESDLPGYWAYARAYGLADHFFANTLGPSFPGHAFLVAAQAAWVIYNPSGAGDFPYWGCDEAETSRVVTLESGSCTVKSVRPCFDIPSVPTLLPSGVDWRFYGTSFGGGSEPFSVLDAIRPIRETALWKNVVNASTFVHDVEAGDLPAVTWLVDEDSDDEHPGRDAGMCAGENWTVAHLNPLVAPPRHYGCDAKAPYGLGFRLPLIVMSPYVKRGVYKRVAEQASIVKFILEAFDAPKYLSDLDPAAQDGQANDLMDMFDWSQEPLDPLVLEQRACHPPPPARR
jgi:phospholipase C